MKNLKYQISLIKAKANKSINRENKIYFFCLAKVVPLKNLPLLLKLILNRKCPPRLYNF